MTTPDYDLQYLDRAVQAARGVKPTPIEYCQGCDEPLIGFQRQIGLCWACQARAEANIRRDIEGV